MTKSEFVDQVADRAGLSKKDAGDAVDAMLETIESALKRGSDVTFSGFGKFSVSERSAREGRDGDAQQQPGAAGPLGCDGDRGRGRRSDGLGHRPTVRGGQRRYPALDRGDGDQ